MIPVERGYCIKNREYWTSGWETLSFSPTFYVKLRAMELTASKQAGRKRKWYVCACVWMRGQKEKKKKIDDITRTLRAFGQNERFFGAPGGRMNVPPCLKSDSRVPCFEWIYQIYMRKRRYTRVYARVLQVENLKRIPPMNR